MTQTEEVARHAHVPEPTKPCPDSLVADEALGAGQQLEVSTLEFSALMQGDGNLVVYRISDWSELWSSQTGGHPDATVAVGDNGNVSICAANGRALWTSATGGNPGAFLQLHGDGQLVVHGFYRDQLWTSTNT